jgi:hypothetical protein
MIKTYSERRQAILFRAARDMRKVAVDALDDVTNPAELTGNSAPWAKSVARKTAETANELESNGHEEAIATARQETDLYQSRREYEQAIDRFEERLRANGVDPRSLS